MPSLPRTALWAAAILTAVAAIAKPRLFGAAPPPRPDELAARFAAELVGKDNVPAPAPGPPAFVECAAEVGLLFVHDHDQRGRFRLPEEMGPGVALLDHDGDGDLDVFVTGGGAIVTGDGPVQTSRLFRNDGGQFVDVTRAANAGVPGPAYGVAAADYDDDGDVDLFVGRVGADAFLRNDRGRFTDIAADIGLADDGFAASAAFFDYDRDGRLDLFVTRYVGWTPERETSCYIPAGLPDYCNPIVYDAPSTDKLYRNLGGGRFADVSVPAGIASETGNGLGVIATDFDEDGWPDLYIANDQTPGFLWHNRGDGTFENIALEAGCAYDRQGIAIAGMGVASEDLDGDGDFDLFVTNILGQTHLVLLNDGGSFRDASFELGLDWSIPLTGFGVALFDQDHDGELDLFVANGAVNIATSAINAANPYVQPNQFARLTDGRFVDASRRRGLGEDDVSRAVTAGDLDGDGDLDLLLTNNGGPLEFFRNDAPRDRAWLMVDARTGPGGRAAIGARITVRAGERVWSREVRPQQSYLASGDPRVHFGLAGVDRVDALTIRWADGHETTRTDIAVNQVYVVLREDTEEAP